MQNLFTAPFNESGTVRPRFRGYHFIRQKQSAVAAVEPRSATMGAGFAAGRALASSLHRISLKPQLLKTPFSSSSASWLQKPSSSSIAPVLLLKQSYGTEFASLSSLWSRRAAPCGSQVGMDGPRGLPIGFSVSGLEGVSTGCFRPTAQSHVFLQGLATQTSTRTPMDSKGSSDVKASLPNKPSASPPPPSTGVVSPPEKPKTKKSGMVKQMLLDFGAVPFPPLVLGIAGLIPFVALAPPLALMLPLPEILAVAHADAQAAYGATILSFLGAVHWGLAMADYAAPGKGGVANMTLMTSRYVWSVVPSLAAWTALLLPTTSKFAFLIFSFWMVLGVDFVFSRMKLVPHWFLSLRWPLTLVATVSMVPSMLAAATWTF